MYRKDDLIYAASMLDGEGSIIISKRSNTAIEQGLFEPEVQISNNDKGIIDYLKDVFGGYITTDIRLNKDTNYKWRLKGDKAISFLLEVLPYIKGRERKRKTRLAIQFQATVGIGPRGKTLLKEVIDERIRLKREIEKNSKRKNRILK